MNFWWYFWRKTGRNRFHLFLNKLLQFFTEQWPKKTQGLLIQKFWQLAGNLLTADDVLRMAVSERKSLKIYKMLYEIMRKKGVPSDWEDNHLSKETTKPPKSCILRDTLAGGKGKKDLLLSIKLLHFPDARQINLRTISAYLMEENYKPRSPPRHWHCQKNKF